VFVFEPRSTSEPGDEWTSGSRADSALAGIRHCHGEVRRLESSYGLPESRDIDPGLFAATYGWASGGGIDDVLEDGDLSAGDFVRSMKQIIDVTAQLAITAPRAETRAAAVDAVDRVRRGIVDSPIEDGTD
jgi:ATP-dependent RNA helicase HelY